MGGGIGLVAASDLAVAVEGATFAFSEVRVGVAPAVISVAVLRKMHPVAAAELMLTGARVVALRVLEAGLVPRVVADDDGLDATVARVGRGRRRRRPRAVAAPPRRCSTGTRDAPPSGLGVDVTAVRPPLRVRRGRRGHGGLPAASPGRVERLLRTARRPTWSRGGVSRAEPAVRVHRIGYDDARGESADRGAAAGVHRPLRRSRRHPGPA